MFRARAMMCLVAVSCSMVAFAEDAPKKKSEAKSIEGSIVRASSIAGMSVRSPDNKSLGKVEDVVIDTHTGTVQYAAISFGGFLGFGDKLFAVPFKALHVKHEPGSKTPHFEMNITQEALEKAKGFDKNHWPDFANANFAQENDRHFIVIEVQKNK